MLVSYVYWLLEVTIATNPIVVRGEEACEKLKWYKQEATTTADCKRLKHLSIVSKQQ